MNDPSLLDASRRSPTTPRAAAADGTQLPVASRVRHLSVALIPTLGTLAAVLSWMLGGLAPRPREFALLAGFYVLNMLGMELALHRYFAHRAFKATPATRGALAVLGSLAYMGPLMWWVAIHRKHHAHTDRPGDPHTPQLGGPGLRGRLTGFWQGHVGWLFTPERARPTAWNRYAMDLYRDPLLLRIHHAYDYWLVLGLLLPMLIDGLIDLSWKSALLGLLWGGTVRILLATNAVWAVNSAGHLFGARPYPARDASGNLFWLALVTLGAGWHNNHHAFPQFASTRLRWWQIDMTAWVIALLERLGLVWDVQHPDPSPVRKKKSGASAKPQD
ncbi:acyl-CoA desaturase [Burkholderia gladioli]|uniref:JamB n=1 Tax=Burkholderia gladioli (strain BSR3) TaxID=999541 RepID=F2LT48_BURGS|nr:acyl-CoA desaturase [Burkholderia gladioli]AEA65924.1 JamB [Burkholderia gladioli BSR3]MBW5286836.1 acyl-CoA desaturase [Burkholderia gladioli]